jgi:hypothetical protein
MLDVREDEVEQAYNLQAPYSYWMFVALCRREGLTACKRPRQRATTVCVKTTLSKHEALWQRFRDLNRQLTAQLGEVTHRFVREHLETAQPLISYAAASFQLRRPTARARARARSTRRMVQINPLQHQQGSAASRDRCPLSLCQGTRNLQTSILSRARTSPSRRTAPARASNEPRMSSGATATNTRTVGGGSARPGVRGCR